MTTAHSAETNLLASAQEQLETGSESLARADQGIRKFTREQPMLATAAALGVGYLVGRVVSKWF